MKHITIKDIAKALNVSVSTVSRAFNDKYDIRPETRDKILKLAKEMGYSPNPIARKLIQQRTFNIGVVVPEFINPFFPRVIMGIQNILIEKGYQILIMPSNENHITELENLKTFVNNFVDGIILSLTKETKNIEYIQELIANDFPLVLFNRVNDSLPVSKVVFDDYKWAFFATEHLIQQGIKRIFHFSGPKHLTLSQNRQKGFEDAMKKYHLNVTGEMVYETGFTLEDGERIAEKLIADDNVPEGIFCVNDPSAIGAVRAFKQNGLRIPRDVAIMGFTQTPMSEFVDPPLSTVVQPTIKMGEIAAELLLNQLESSEPVEPKFVVLNGKMNIRESSLKKDN